MTKERNKGSMVCFLLSSHITTFFQNLLLLSAVGGGLKSVGGIRAPNLIEVEETWQDIGYLKIGNKRQLRSDRQI